MACETTLQLSELTPGSPNNELMTGLPRLIDVKAEANYENVVLYVFWYFKVSCFLR